MHGVLKSWAVPKGVPQKPDERRLAMATEDHPVEYLDFEGTIPQGQYGGGTVMVWDIGTYDIIEGNYYKGDLQISLRGQKLGGAWHLTREDGRKWVLMRLADEAARRPRRPPTDGVSAVSGRTMERIAEDNDRQWHSNRASGARDSSSFSRRRAATADPLDLAKLPDAMVKFVEPMRPLLVTALPEGPQWSYEQSWTAIELSHSRAEPIYSYVLGTTTRSMPGSHGLRQLWVLCPPIQ
jgi:bifunctional non-homologous end joining protein LigD